MPLQNDQQTVLFFFEKMSRLCLLNFTVGLLSENDPMDLPQIFYAIPLIVVFSLVYAGTRHELPEPILRHAAKFALGVTIFMVAIGCVFELFKWVR